MLATYDFLTIFCLFGPWTPELRRVWTTDYMQKMVDAGGKLRAPKDNSLNKWLRRTEDKLGLDHHSWHSVRRRIAQDKYDAYRGSGMTRMDALSKVSLWLNHGPNRQILPFLQRIDIPSSVSLTPYAMSPTLTPICISNR